MALPPTVRDAADLALIAAILDLVRAEPPDLVAAYAPLPGEPGGARLVAALAAAVPRLLLPILLDDFDLDWAEFHPSGPGRGLRAGRFGLTEPTGERLGIRSIATANLILAPGLAVDRAGTRLGQGGGSYDRALARTDAPVLVPLYPGEFVDELPAEPHDRRVAAALVGYETPHLHWTKAVPMPHHWHSEYPSANDGG